MSRLAAGLCAVSWLLLLGHLRLTLGYPHRSVGQLELFQKVAISTAEQDFIKQDGLFAEALDWDVKRLKEPGRTSPYLACAKYIHGREAFSNLGEFLGAHSVHRLSNSPAQGTCFIASASPVEAAEISEDLASKRLNQFILWPSVLKLSPGLLDHEVEPFGSAPLSTTHGKRMRLSNVHGLEVELSPGFLENHPSPSSFVALLRESLMSNSLSLYDTSFWTGNKRFESGDGHPFGSSPGVERRARDWKAAADLVHSMQSKKGHARSPGEACSWNKLTMRQSSGSLILTGELPCS